MLGKRQRKFLSRLPQPATNFDRTGPNRLTNPDNVSTHFIQACDFNAIEPLNPSIGLMGFVPPASPTNPTLRTPSSVPTTLSSTSVATDCEWKNLGLSPDYPAVRGCHRCPSSRRRIASQPSVRPHCAQGLTTKPRLAAFSLVHVTIKTPPRHRLNAFRPTHARSNTKTPPRHRLTAFPPAHANPRPRPRRPNPSPRSCRPTLCPRPRRQLVLLHFCRPHLYLRPRRRIALMLGESRRGRWRSSQFGFQATRPLPIVRLGRRFRPLLVPHRA